jgi:hypothetical protein
MFRLTALGHHSWLVEGQGTRLLVDPILTEDWGFSPAVGLRVWPPRVLDLAAFPPVDAVMLTHEHEGHFEIPSLLRLDRRIPIYVSARGSVAMRGFLVELGFDVRPIEHDSSFEVGEMRVHTMCPDHRKAIADEWEVLPYLVADKAGNGNFFTHVDTSLVDAMWKRCRELVERPGLFALTDNHNDLAVAVDTALPRNRDLEATATYLAQFCRDLSRVWAPPAAWLMVGQGFAFGGDNELLNGACFHYGIDELAEIVGLMHVGEPIRWLQPGMTACMQRGELVEVLPEMEFNPNSAASRPARVAGDPTGRSDLDLRFIRSRPRADWPVRSVGKPDWLPDFGPATGQAALDDEQLAALSGELDSLAAYLHGRKGFRRGFSLAHDELGGREPTLAIVTWTDDGAFVWAYQAQGCRFVSVDEADPMSRYAGVFECWASDLLAVLRAELSANTLLFGRARARFGIPDRYPYSLFDEILRYVHPLRHPARFRALYERVRSRFEDVEPVIRWGGAKCSS